jgi:Na+/H+ antiporter NhaD/arsenite permease-like protein
MVNHGLLWLMFRRKLGGVLPAAGRPPQVITREARLILAVLAATVIAFTAGTSALFLAGSNIVSNVPFILVVRAQMDTLPDPRLGWELLAMASTFAGNLTLLGSVANVIVAEKAQRVGGLGFFENLRVGLPLALLTTLLGTAWLLAMG